MPKFELFVFFTSTMLPLGIFTFYRNILDNRKNDKIIYAITGVIFVIGLILSEVYEGFFGLFLTLPLISFQLYKIALASFISSKKRIPKDTAYDFSSGLFYDRLFNIGYLVFGWLLPFLIVMILADELRDMESRKAETARELQERQHRGDAFGIAKCTVIDKGNLEDFAFYEFFVDEKRIEGVTAILKDSGEELVGKYFKVNYSSEKPRESILLVQYPITNKALIIRAGFKIGIVEPFE